MFLITAQSFSMTARAASISADARQQPLAPPQQLTDFRPNAALY